MKIFNFFVLFLLTNITIAQSDSTKANSVEYNKDYQFNDGVFLNFAQVKKNEAIPTNRIVSLQDINDFEYFELTLENEEFIYFDTFGVKQEAETSNVWGYSQGGTLNINYNNDFYRVGVVGSICHFVANKTVDDFTYSPYNSYYIPNSSQTSSVTELRQYLLDFKTGIVYDYTYKNLEIILMNDPELYDEYNSLKKRKRKKLKFVYIRKYNSRNKIYLPK